MDYFSLNIFSCHNFRNIFQEWVYGRDGRLFFCGEPLCPHILVQLSIWGQRWNTLFRAELQNQPISHHHWNEKSSYHDRPMSVDKLQLPSRVHYMTLGRSSCEAWLGQSFIQVFHLLPRLWHVGLITTVHGMTEDFSSSFQRAVIMWSNVCVAKMAPFLCQVDSQRLDDINTTHLKIIKSYFVPWQHSQINVSHESQIHFTQWFPRV